MVEKHKVAAFVPSPESALRNTATFRAAVVDTPPRIRPRARTGAPQNQTSHVSSTKLTTPPSDAVGHTTPPQEEDEGHAIIEDKGHAIIASLYADLDFAEGNLTDCTGRLPASTGSGSSLRDITEDRTSRVSEEVMEDYIAVKPYVNPASTTHDRTQKRVLKKGVAVPVTRDKRPDGSKPGTGRVD